MKAGDFFWGDPTQCGKEHPWVLLNDPTPKDGYGVLLNFTDDKLRNLEDSVPIGYHKTITKISVPSWGDMLVWSDSQISNALSCDLLRSTPPPLSPVKVSLLKNRILGFGFVPRELKKLL